MQEMDLDQQKGLRKGNPKDNLEFVSGYYGMPPFVRAGSPSSMIVNVGGALSEAGT